MTNQQKANSRLTLHHSCYVIVIMSRRRFIILSHQEVLFMMKNGIQSLQLLAYGMRCTGKVLTEPLDFTVPLFLTEEPRE
ncbi:hypothetical protein VULLAG_LOCUS12645 [Vulpes lagopus]